MRRLELAMSGNCQPTPSQKRLSPAPVPIDSTTGARRPPPWLTKVSATAVVKGYTVDEPTTRPFLQWLHANDRQVLLPVSRNDGLLDWVVSDGTETEGLFGLPEPVGELLGPIAINDVDLIVVPAAAVDQGGMRMGWGRGYFDKTLGSMEACPPVYAVVFDAEFVDELPREKHDMPVDGIVTPTLIHSF